MRLLCKFLKFLLCFLLFTGAALVGWGVYLAKTRVPVLDGAIAHPALKGEARAVRDTWGIPHITAEFETDAYFALGYVMAQDRLFQMEAFRRVASGELAELLGARLVPIDKILRTFQLRSKAEGHFEKMEKDYPKLRALLEAYVAGVNHRQETEPLPLEFAVLGITPRPFTPGDCLSVGALLPITFADGLREDALASMLREKHPDMNIDLLFPGYSLEVPVTVMESLEEAAAILAERQAPVSENAASGGTAPPKALDALAGLLEPLNLLTRHFGPALGSNSWVLGPSRTVSGKSILANDPHIGFTNPSIWYEAHLRSGDFEIYGFHLPLIPLSLLGHNRHHAWALTMFANDDVDLFVETFDPQDPSKVMYQGSYVEATLQNQTIKVRFGDDQTFSLRTTPHGPIVTDLLQAVSGYAGPDVSLSWVWQQVDYTDMAGFYEMARAVSYDAFAAGVSKITSPGLNISYADADGNIAWWAAGLPPIRPDHVNSKGLLDGASGKDEILGYITFEDWPHLKNPAWGYIATANNRPTLRPVGPIDKIEGYWQPGDRAGRIEYLLEQRSDWTIQDLQAVQLDDSAYAAPPIVETLVTVIHDAAPTLTGTEAAALALLEGWDFRHGADSCGASLYQVLVDHVLRYAVEDEMGETLFKTYGGLADHWNFFKYLVKENDLAFWDDQRTPESEGRSEIVVRAFRDSVAWLTQRFGEDHARWKWGRLHTLEFRHPFGYLPLAGKLLNLGPYPVGGGAQIINNMLYMAGQLDYGVVAGPSTRRLIDFGNIENTLAVLPTGNSGNFQSVHYGDQAPLFVRGEYRRVNFTGDQISASKTHELVFKPVG